MKFKNTIRFSYLAEFFKKNKCYTSFPANTPAWKEFWDDIIFKCKYGYTIKDATEEGEDITISGPHFFYLNFIKIDCYNEETGRQQKGFPKFTDVDYDYFHIVERARKENKGVILVKPRRTGFSYKNAALVTWEYNFYKDTKCIIGSFLGRLSANTMGMVLDNVNFLDKETVWVKPRNPDTKELIKARHKVNIDGVEIWKGYMSEVMTLSFKDNPFASVGKRCSIFIWEEGGTFENLVNSYGLTEPCWKDGNRMVGLPIVFGTGGDMEGGTRDFASMFYEPSKYNLLEFDNIWDEGKSEYKCGWFIPATRGRFGIYLDIFGRHPELKGIPFIDENGNSNEELSRLDIEEERESKRKTSNSQSIKNTITQYPLNTSEAFLRSSGNIFPVIELQERLAQIETSDLKNFGQTGELYFNQDSKIKFKLSPDVVPITNYPLRTTDNKEGCVVIYEHPEYDNPDLIPYGQYIAGCDPYDQDKSTTGSLGSFFVYKTMRGYKLGKTSKYIVAEYTGRPEKADDFYENCRRLCIFYNAKCLYENQLKGFKNYFLQKHSIHYLYEQPNNMIKDIIKDSKVNRGYGIHMNRGSGGATGIKDQCEIYLKQWLTEEREDHENKKYMNLQTINSIPLLQELIAYDREGNFDRVIALMLCILQDQENYQLNLEEIKEGNKENIDKFFTKKLFISSRSMNDFYK